MGDKRVPVPLSDLPTWVLGSAATRAHHVLRDALAAAGVTGYEYRCLAVLSARDRLSQAEVGAAAALDPRDVTHTLRTLAARHLVERTKDPDHGRRVRVSLTPEGHRTAARLAGVMADVQAVVFGRLTPDERDTLVALLSRVG